MTDIRHTQNFLHSERLVQALVSLAGIAPGATVLEIGAGKGIITAQLARTVGEAGRVLALELDSALIPALTRRFAGTPQVSIVHADLLTWGRERLPAGYQAFANVPFSITTDALDWLFLPDAPDAPLPSSAHLILQRQALISPSPHGEGETLKGLLIKPRYTVSEARRLDRADYTPRPSVDTALFAFQRRTVPLVPAEQFARYKDFVAYVAKDRFGEGAWRRAFSKGQLRTLVETDGLIDGRGIRSQSVEGLVAAFRRYQRATPQAGVIEGALAALRAEQARREAINQRGGHHPSRRRR